MTVQYSSDILLCCHLSRPRYKWGQVTYNSVGVITAISRNGKDVTVNYPEQNNWTGLISEMEMVPSVHMWFR